MSDYLSGLLVLAGGFFALVSATEVLRMPDFFTGLHAAGTFNALPREVGVPNMVTAVLASYRGYDTLGEVTVIFTGALGC